MESENSGTTAKEQINIREFFEIAELQKLQDLFAEVHQIASLITYPDGTPITQASNFSSLCSDVIRQTEKGARNCFRSDSVIGRYNADGPTVRRCLSAGLWDGGVSVNVGDKHVANWLIGQVKGDDFEEDSIARYADEIGVDRGRFIRAYRDVTVMSESKFRKIAELLYVYVNQLTEKIHTKQLLVQANNQFEQITKSLPDIIWMGEWNTDTGGIVHSYISDVADELLVLPKGTINNSFDKYFSYLPPEYKENLNVAISKALQNQEKEYSIIYEIKKGNGELSWFETTGKGYKHGSAVRIVGVTKDITESKKIKQQLKENEERYRELTEHLPSGVAVYRPIDDGNDFVFVDFNSSAEKITSTSKENIIGKKLSERFPNMAESPLFIAVREVYETGEEVHLDPICYSDSVEGRWRENSIYKLPSGEIVAIFKDVTALKKAQDKLKRKNKKLKEAKKLAKQSAHRFKALHDASFGGIAIHDKGVILDCNFGLSKLSGYSHEELVGMNGLSLIAEEARELVMNNIIEGYEESYEVIAIKKNGERYPVRLEGRMIHYKGKKVRVVEFRDITEKKRLEKEQIRREKLLNETGRIAKIGGWELDLATMQSYYSHEAKRIYGLPVEDEPPKGIEGLKNYPLERQKTIKQVLKQAVDTGKPYDLETPFISEKGEEKWVRTIGLAEKEDGKVVRLYGTIQDITDQIKQEQRNLRLSEAIEQSPVCIVVTDLEGRIEYVNPTFQKVTGFNQEEVIGEKTNMLSSGYHDSQFYKNLWNTLLSGKSWQGEFCNKRKNGNLYWESARISPIKDKNGKTLSYLAIKEDITVTKQMICDLKESKEKAEQSDRLKSAFLANMSHEIRTPMNSILGFIELIQMPNLNDDDRAEFSKVINESGERLLDTINDLIEYSKIEAGDIPLVSEEFRLAGVFEFQLNFFELIARKKGLDISLNISEELQSTMVRTDRNKLNSILTNLINNAIKFTNQGKVSFGFELDQNQVKCYVSDTGNGIPKEKIDAIFERFIQADLNLARKYEGSGLGLAICKGYLDKMGGTIWVESEVGKGSTFYFTVNL
jgi:hypothetical protein